MARTVPVFLVVFFFSLTAGAVAPTSLVQTFEFGEIAKDKPWAGDWLRVPGFPEVPAVNAKIVLPYGKKFKSAKFQPKERGERREAGEARLVPIPQPLCDVDVKYDGETRQTFKAGDAYPANYLGDVIEESWLGYRMIIVPLYVRKYFPANKELAAISGGELTVELENDDRPELLRNQRKDRELVAAVVSNPDTLSTYPMPLTTRSVEYLAIAPQSFIDDEAPYSLKQLMQEKESRAIPTKMLSVESIQSTYSGRDQQEKIRNAILDAYKKDGIRYVLLVGNGHSVLPARNMKVNMNEGTIPSDLYFACLDGDFDGNKNNVFGETRDGVGGKDVDLACEVAVGRAPVTTSDDMHAFVKKSLSYQRIAFFDGRIWNTLSFGEKLDASTLGSKCLDQLEKGGTAGELSTQGFPGAAKFTKLHETFSKTYSADEAVRAMKTGEFYTVNHLGHCNETFCMRMSSDRIPEITNEIPFFGITQGCHPGNLRKPNWASKLVTSSTGGAAALVANSNYGWYNQASADGPSNRFHLTFYDTVFRDGLRNLGQIHFRAKTKMIPDVTSATIMRWVVYETNLLGDPELELRF